MQIRSTERASQRSFRQYKSVDYTNSLAPTVPFMQKRFFAAIPETKQALDSRILPVIRGKIRSHVQERTDTQGKTNRSNFLLPISKSHRSEKTIEPVEEEEEVELKPRAKEEYKFQPKSSLKFLKYKFEPERSPITNVDEQYGQFKKWRARKTIDQLVRQQFIYAPHPKHPQTFKQLFSEKYG